MTGPRLAVIGCGAMTRDMHLPALSRSRDFRLVGLVDAKIEHARDLAGRHDVAWTAEDHREAIGRADAVLLAVPHHLHAPLALDFLRNGVHVLVEKPMALTVDDCDRMIDAAGQAGVVLAVGLNRRFFESNRLVARLAWNRVLGAARRFELSGEGVYPWPMRSAYRFGRREAGGGVLVDTGVHALDLLAWWFGDCEGLEYRDDAEGGVEAECHISLAFAGGVSGEVVLSKLREVPNRFRFDFEGGALVVDEAGSEPSPQVRLRVARREWRPEGGVIGGAPVSRKEIFRRQLADFAGAIRERREPFVPGREGRRSVALLQRCYEVRRPLAYPWEHPRASSDETG